MTPKQKVIVMMWNNRINSMKRELYMGED